MAQDDVPKSTIAIVGDAERFNLGQGDFCATRAEVPSPSGRQFRVPSNKATYFYIQSRFRVQVATYTCEGDFSFTPAPNLLHIIRYTLVDDRCVLEMFQSEPGGTPKPMAFKREPSQSCLFK